MSDAIDPRYLEIFPAWLRTLGEDAGALGEIVGAHASAGGHEASQRYLVAGLNYIFKSLDLIPDGIDDLGYMDDAFVLRVGAALAVSEDASLSQGASESVVARLAADAKEVKSFLGDDYARLEAYVRGLRKGAARGRTVEDVITEDATRATFLSEVSAWAKEYATPSFTRDVKTLIKLRAFLSAKLA